MLDFTRLLPGAFATALLADLGADVLKVEQPGGGDPMRGYLPRIGETSAYTWVADRNKRSLAVNLRDPRGVEIALGLAAEATAVIESFRPGVAERLGIGYETVRELNPAAVYCSISGYGADGPLAGEVGHDLNYLGRAGVLGVTGVAGRPALPGVQIADLTGSMLGLVGLLSAIVRAQSTGEGDHVDVSMTDGAFALNALSLGAFFAEGRVPGIESELLNGGVPCYAIYECADGRRLTVGSLEEPFWRALCEAVGRPDLVPTQLDAEALPLWRELFAARPRGEWLRLLAGHEACVGPVNDLAEAIAEPQLRHRRMVVEQEAPGLGPTPQLGTPIKLREHPAQLRRPAPGLGDATETSLAALGYDAVQIGELVAAGVVAAASRPDLTIGQ